MLPNHWLLATKGPMMVWKNSGFHVPMRLLLMIANAVRKRLRAAINRCVPDGALPMTALSKYFPERVPVVIGRVEYVALFNHLALVLGHVLGATRIMEKLSIAPR